MRLFNTQRKLALLAQKFQQYLVYAIGEIILITIGILLALQLNNWNKDLEEREQEAILLNKLHIEFKANHQDLEASIEHVGIVVARMTDFLTLMGPSPNLVEERIIHEHMATYHWRPAYIPNKVVFDMAFNSGDVNLIKNTALQEKLHEWAEILASNNSLVESLTKHQYNLATPWSGLHSWKSSIAMTGEMEGIGPSNFPFDQKKFLSLPALEHAVSMKLILAHIQKGLLTDIKSIQHEIMAILKNEIETK